MKYPRSKLSAFLDERPKVFALPVFVFVFPQAKTKRNNKGGIQLSVDPFVLNRCRNASIVGDI